MFDDIDDEEFQRRMSGTVFFKREIGWQHFRSFSLDTVSRNRVIVIVRAEISSYRLDYLVGLLIIFVSLSLSLSLSLFSRYLSLSRSLVRSLLKSLLEDYLRI